MRICPVHLVCFLFLLAALGTAHAVPFPGQETTLRTHALGDVQRRAFRVFHPRTGQGAQDAVNDALVLPVSACVPGILGTGNHPATRSIAQQAFTSSLR